MNSIRINPEDRVILNVGGSHHEIIWKILANYPNTRLGKLYSLMTIGAETTPAIATKSSPKRESSSTIDSIRKHYDGFSVLNNNIRTQDQIYGQTAAAAAVAEFYFDRNPIAFPSILNLYRLGELHLLDSTMCTFALEKELNYWQVGEEHFEYCCQQKHWTAKEAIVDDMKKDLNFHKKYQPDYDSMNFGTERLGKWKKWIWIAFDQPQSSNFAYALGLLSMFLTLVSTAALIINSIPSIQAGGCKLRSTKEQSSTSPTYYYCDVNENIYTRIIDGICIAFFTIEYILRLFTCPYKPITTKFLIRPLNIIDMLSILPFYITIILLQFNIDSKSIRSIFSILRLIKIFRIFKLARHSLPLQSLFITLRNSYKELGVLLLFLSMGMTIFSCLAYFAERNDENSSVGFESIPATFWWSVITMTTVGYGDVSPNTYWGKIIGGFCAISGVLVIAMPIPFIVEKFTEYYKDQQRRRKMATRRNKLIIKDDSKRKSFAATEMLFSQFRLAEVILSDRNDSGISVASNVKGGSCNNNYNTDNSNPVKLSTTTSELGRCR